MKKVLLIAHVRRAFPRIPALIKYLPEFGWQPIVLTPDICHYTDFIDILAASLKRCFGFTQEMGMKVQAERYFGITSSRALILKSLLRFSKNILYYPDRDRFWKSSGIKLGMKILKNNPVDAMISSSAPVTSHLIAKELKVKYGIPWVADLRDLWSQNHNYPYNYIRNIIDRRLELKTLSFADALVTVSQPWVNKLKILHKRKSVYLITNGFDPDEANITAPLTTNFTITHTGTIYEGKQSPDKFFIALKELISEGALKSDEIEVRFYGINEVWLENRIKKYGLLKIVKQYGRVPSRNEFLKKQRESQLLLLLNWEDKREKGYFPLKLFEYLASKRPILAVGGFGNDVISKLLSETKAGFYTKEVDEVKRVLKKLYLEYKYCGKVSYDGSIEVINKYNYREIARKYAEILNTFGS
ncbi:MAG: hypothetical protein QXK35_07555 [Nitrososphaerales archaeon]